MKGASNMLDTYKTAIINQFEASFCTLDLCIDRCSETYWDMRIGNFSFSHVAFHTMIFADLYLSENETEFRNQPFHRDHLPFFNDYDELTSDSTQTTPDKPAIQRYLQFCRNKAVEVISAETEESLDRKAGFDWLDFTRAELHVYNMRHLQHHAAHVGLRLRAEAQQEIPWVKSGWRELTTN